MTVADGKQPHLGLISMLCENTNALFNRCPSVLVIRLPRRFLSRSEDFSNRNRMLLSLTMVEDEMVMGRGMLIYCTPSK